MTADLRPAGPGEELCGAPISRLVGVWCDLPKGHDPIAPPSWLHAVSVAPTMGGPVTEPGKELVGPLPTVVFFGGPHVRWGRRYMDARPRVAYTVPRDTRDPRFAACTDHHVACDCREAEQAENLAEHRAEWRNLRDAARRALAGHQIENPYGEDGRDFPLCLCSGCVIQRATSTLLSWSDVDFRTGRVKPVEPTYEEVPF